VRTARPTSSTCWRWFKRVVSGRATGAGRRRGHLVGAAAVAGRFPRAALGHLAPARDRLCRNGLVDVAGGKLTTYRLIAQQAVDEVFRQLSRTPAPCTTADRPLVESAGQKRNSAPAGHGRGGCRGPAGTSGRCTWTTCCCGGPAGIITMPTVWRSPSVRPGGWPVVRLGRPRAGQRSWNAIGKSSDAMVTARARSGIDRCVQHRSPRM